MHRKPQLKREVLTEIDLARVVGAEAWSSNPACILSIGPCVTALCSNLNDVCIAPIRTS